MEMQDVDYELGCKDEADPLDYLLQTPATRDRKRQHREDHQMDCECRACGSHHMNQRRNPER